MSAPRVLSVEEGFRRWAPTYDETPLSRLELRAFAAVAPPLAGRRLLDAGCGTGRRLLPLRGGADAPSLAVGVDLSDAMLERARAGIGVAHVGSGEGPGGGADAPRPRFVRGDLGRLPFRGGAFDLVWCRLTLGFLSDLEAPLLEMARVLASGCELVLTDLHPSSQHGGTARSFRDARGDLLAVAHHVHPVPDLVEACARAGLAETARVELEVGPDVRDVFDGETGGRVYEELLGRPVVVGLRLRSG